MNTCKTKRGGIGIRIAILFFKINTFCHIMSLRLKLSFAAQQIERKFYQKMENMIGPSQVFSHPSRGPIKVQWPNQMKSCGAITQSKLQFSFPILCRKSPKLAIRILSTVTAFPFNFSFFFFFIFLGGKKKRITTASSFLLFFGEANKFFCEFLISKIQFN